MLSILIVFLARKLIPYHTGRYGRNLPYQCLGQNRNTAISFHSKYQVISGRTDCSEKNTGYRPENENQLVKCKPMKKKKKKRNPDPCCRFHFSGSDATSLIIFHLLFVFDYSSSSSFIQSCSTSVSLLTN